MEPTHQSGEFLTPLQTYCFTILGSISFISGIFLLWGYVKIRSMREGGGPLMLYICISLIILSFYDSYTAYYQFLRTNQLLRAGSCQLHGAIIAYFTVLYWHYMLSFSIREISLSLKRPIRRFRVFHLTNHSISIIVACFLYWTSSSGVSSVCHCYIAEHSIGRYISLMFFVYVPVYVAGTLAQRNCESLYIGLLTLFTFPLCISQLVQENWIIDIAIFFRSSQCFVICLMKLMQTEASNNPQLSESLLEEGSERPSYIYFNELDEHKIMITLLCLDFILQQAASDDPQDRQWVLSKDEFVRHPDLFEEYMNCECKITEYAPVSFNQLRLQDNWSSSDLSESLSPVQNKPLAQAKRFYVAGEHIIFYTHDSRLMLKELTWEEKEGFCKTLPDYYEYLVGYSKNKSLLARILGLYTVSHKENTHFAVLQNMIPGEIKNPVLFELKGKKSEGGILKSPCTVNQMSSNTVYKDFDFMQSQQFLYLAFQDSYWLKKMIKEDLEFLTNHKSIGYSFFIAVGENLGVRKYDLLPRYARHSYLGNGNDSTKIYVVGILDALKQNQDAEEYASHFCNAIFNIFKCIAV